MRLKLNPLASCVTFKTIMPTLISCLRHVEKIVCNAVVFIIGENILSTYGDVDLGSLMAPRRHHAKKCNAGS